MDAPKGTSLKGIYALSTGLRGTSVVSRRCLDDELLLVWRLRERSSCPVVAFVQELPVMRVRIGLTFALAVSALALALDYQSAHSSGSSSPKDDTSSSSGGSPEPGGSSSSGSSGQGSSSGSGCVE